MKVGQGNVALNGSKSSSNTKFSFILKHIAKQKQSLSYNPRAEVISYNKSYVVYFLLSIYKFFLEVEIFKMLNCSMLNSETLKQTYSKHRVLDELLLSQKEAKLWLPITKIMLHIFIPYLKSSNAIVK